MWAKQKEALGILKRRVKAGRGCCLFSEMGTGKTRIVVRWLQYLFRTHKIRTVYIAGPLAALYVWVENWHDWADIPVAFIDLHETGSAGVREAKRLSKAGMPVICLVNYESAWQIGLKRVKRKRGGKEVFVREQLDTAMRSVKWDIGILDESTAIKTPGSVVSKYFRTQLAKNTTHKLVMTGSAYTKRPLDVWAQVSYACGNEVFPSTFGAFKALYAIPHPTIRGAVVGYHNLDDLARRLSHCAVLLKKTDMFDLPPYTHTKSLLELSPKSRRIYDQLTEDTYVELAAIEERRDELYELEAELKTLDEERDLKRISKIADRIDYLKEEGVLITAEHIFTRIRKFQQITSGFIIPDITGDNPFPEPIRLGTEKVDDLMEKLELRDGNPTVIVVQLNEEEKIISEAIAKNFNFKPKILNGSVKGAEARHKLIASASKDMAFIVKESVGAKGVDMRWSDMIVFYSHSYDTEDYEQMMARNHRGGQTKNVTYHHLLVRDTIDMKLMAALQRDLNLAASIEHNWRQLF